MLENMTADHVSATLVKLLKPMPKRDQPLTYDNGKEFADNAIIDSTLGSRTNFVYPYSSWRRGSNKNLNVPMLQ
jgi:IS30 family transposase